MAKLIIVEGPDNSGKSTLIQELKHLGAVEIEFPKRVSTLEIFKIESRREVQTFETMLDHLDPTKTYILDRGYLSNVIYESLRGKDSYVYLEDTMRLIHMHNVRIVPLTRNHLDVDFVDDNIKLSASDFNVIINKYEELYEKLWVKPVKYLEHDGVNNVITSRLTCRQMIENLKLDKFIKQ